MSRSSSIHRHNEYDTIDGTAIPSLASCLNPTVPNNIFDLYGIDQVSSHVRRPVVHIGGNSFSRSRIKDRNSIIDLVNFQISNATKNAINDAYATGNYHRRLDATPVVTETANDTGNLFSISVEPNNFTAKAWCRTHPTRRLQ